MGWVYVEDPKDTGISKAKIELIGNIISFLEDDKEDGAYALETMQTIKLIKLIFDATKFLTFNTPTDQTGKTVGTISPINISIVPKA